MRLLLDTHVLIWSTSASARLRDVDRAMIEDPGHLVFFSVASIWESAIKFALKRPEFTVDPLALVGAARRQFTELPVTSSAAIRVASLPPHHRDPFDRLLVAQAIEERAILLTADAALASYAPHIRSIAPAGASPH